jgi:class 3 adenylate cyclase/tetratricopeptide (TPR) repeat protein
MKCPACSADNPEAHNFCGQCGTRLSTSFSIAPAQAAYTPPHLARMILTSRSALEGERKLVTVLFCDIANSTPLVARVGAEAMHGLLNRFFELALAEVHRYEGTINQFLGDGFMALFGAPVAHEDHARRALLAASGIRQRLRGTPAGAGPLDEVRLRIGVNTGTVVVGKIGDNLRMDYTAVGDTTNLAARLQQHAEPGAIRTSESTYRAAVDYFEFKPLGKHTLKGIAEPVKLYDLIGARTEGGVSLAGEQEGLRSPLVGRDQELARLSASLEALAEGRGGVVILQGEPGAGKSRLVAEARRRAGGGLLWLEGRALSFGRNLSYWPFIEIVKGCFGIEPGDTEAQVWAKLEQAARDLFGAHADERLPYLATMLALELSGEREGRVKFLDAQALGRQVFLTMHELFDRLAGNRPVALVLEDWHWVDHSSVTLCEHLLPLTRSHGLLLWFATRAEPAEPTARIRAAATADGGTAAVEIVLSPLGEDQSRALFDNLVGTRDLPDAVRGQIVARTGGNPFFIEEVLRALIADGTLVCDPRSGHWRLATPLTTVALPDTIQAVIVARIDRLDEGVKSVLKLAAVIGRSFFLRVLQAIAEAGDDVERSLAELEHAELVRLRQELPELEYIFKHALVQEAVYGSILVERRRAIHRMVAEALERLFGDRLDKLTSHLAYHYALAEDWEAAQAYLFRAGDQAGRMAADAEALELYRQADAAYARVAARQLEPLQRAMLDRKLGQAFYGIGSYEQSVEHCTRALAHLGITYPRTRWGVRFSMLKFLAAHFLPRLRLGMGPATRRTMDVPTAQEVSTICRTLAWLDYWVDEERFGLDGLIELYAGERSREPVGHARGLATLGVILITLRAFALAGRRLDAADTIARRSTDPAAIAVAALGRGWLEVVTGSLDAARASLQQSATTYKDIGDVRGWGGPSCLLYWVSYWRGELASIGELASEMLRTGRHAGDPHLTSWGYNGLGLLALTAGPLDEAAAHLSAVCDLTARISSFRFQAGAGGLLAMCRLRQGRLTEAAGVLATSLGLIETRKLRGEWSADPLNAAAEHCLAQASRLTGAPRREALRAAHRACAKALQCTRHAVAWLPATERLRGSVAWLSGDPRSAQARWRGSLAAAERLDMVVERARTLFEMGQRSEDIAFVDEALVVFDRIGARVDSAFALHARARIGSASGAHDASTLEEYDRAIAALEEVKAEYELGVACRSRARIQQGLGHLDLARADMARARDCFATTGAVDDLAGVEEEAGTLDRPRFTHEGPRAQDLRLHGGTSRDGC